MLVAIELFLSVHPTWRSTMKSAVAEETRGSDPVAVAGWFLGDLLRTLCCIKLYAAVVFDFVHSLSVQVLARPGVDKRILTTRVTEVFGTEVLSISSILISCFSRLSQAGSQHVPTRRYPHVKFDNWGHAFTIREIVKPRKKTWKGSKRPWKTNEIRFVQTGESLLQNSPRSILRIHASAVYDCMVQKLWVLSLYDYMILIEFDWYDIWIYEISFLKHFINCTFIQTALFNLSFPGIQCGMFCRGSFPAFHEAMAWVGRLHSLGSGTSCPRIRSRNWTWRIIRTVVCMLRTSPSWSSKVFVTSSKWWRCKRKEDGHKILGKNTFEGSERLVSSQFTAMVS